MIVKVLNTFFLDFIKDSHLSKTYIDQAIELITRQNGKMRIEDLCIQLNVMSGTEKFRGLILLALAKKFH